METTCIIEICLGGEWLAAGEVSLIDDPLRGVATPSRFSYDLEYAFAHLGRGDEASVSLRYPVDVADHRLRNWPPFLLDLLPTGAGRRRLCLSFGLPDGAAADWELLRRAGGPPPGNLRIRPSQPEASAQHPGFKRSEVVERAEGFIDHCLRMGYPIGGSSAAQGESPKALLSQDDNGLFHPSGTLPDERVACEWLVKFPRGRTEIDRKILRAEAVYYEVARRMGCVTGASLLCEGDCLFIPRFDVRTARGRLHRSGLETMASAMGKTSFVETASLDEFALAIRQFSSSPLEDLKELIRRDILNVALGNTDNHSRNTSFLKGKSAARLSPLYDFAPMMVDPEWIARTCRWRDYETGGYPLWGEVASGLASGPGETGELLAAVAKTLALLENVPRWLRDAGVGSPILERCEERCRRVMEGGGT